MAKHPPNLNKPGTKPGNKSTQQKQKQKQSTKQTPSQPTQSQPQSKPPKKKAPPPPPLQSQASVDPYLYYRTSLLQIADLSTQLQSSPSTSFLQRSDHAGRLSVFDELLAFVDFGVVKEKSDEKMKRVKGKKGKDGDDTKKKKNDGDDEDKSQSDSDSDSDDEEELITLNAPQDTVNTGTWSNPKLKSLTILSLSQIFTDLLPSYRIRIHTELEKGTSASQISKDVKDLRKYEERLLNAYQRYLKVLGWWSEKCRKDTTSSEHGISLSMKGKASHLILKSCIKALCTNLSSNPTFNFASNITDILLTILGRKSRSKAANLLSLPNRSSSTYVSESGSNSLEHMKLITECIRGIFKNDKSNGLLTLDLVKGLHKIIKESTTLILNAQSKARANGVGYSEGVYLHPDVIQVFRSLPLRIHSDESSAAKVLKSTLSKRRKKSEAAANLESDMNEGDAGNDKGELARIQAEVLELVMVSYFRVIKCISGPASSNNNGTKGDTSSDEGPSESLVQLAESLLPCVLEGIGGFVHLVNIDTVISLLQVLKDLIGTHFTPPLPPPGLTRKDADLLEDEKEREAMRLNGGKVNKKRVVHQLPLPVTLSIILTSLRTVSGVGRELKVDEKVYISALYREIPRLAECMLSLQVTPSVASFYDFTAAAGSSDSDYLVNKVQESDVLVLLLACLDHAFLRRRELSKAVPAAFAKQLLTTGLAISCVSTPASVSLMQFARAIMHRYATQCSELLDSEEDQLSTSQYDYNCANPNDCSVSNTSLWELSNLQYSHSHEVRRVSTDMLLARRLNLPREDSTGTYKRMSDGLRSFIIKFKLPVKVHPLRKVRKGGKGGKGNNRQRFIKVAERDLVRDDDGSGSGSGRKHVTVVHGAKAK